MKKDLTKKKLKISFKKHQEGEVSVFVDGIPIKYQCETCGANETWFFVQGYPTTCNVCYTPSQTLPILEKTKKTVAVGTYDIFVRPTEAFLRDIKEALILN